MVIKERGLERGVHLLVVLDREPKWVLVLRNGVLGVGAPRRLARIGGRACADDHTLIELPETAPNALSFRNGTIKVSVILHNIGFLLLRGFILKAGAFNHPHILLLNFGASTAGGGAGHT